MKDWLKDRAKDPATYLGVGLLIEGMGNLAKVKEATDISDAVQAAAPSLVQGDWSTGLLALVMGVAGIFMRSRLRVR